MNNSPLFFFQKNIQNFRAKLVKKFGKIKLENFTRKFRNDFSQALWRITYESSGGWPTKILKNCPRKISKIFYKNSKGFSIKILRILCRIFHENCRDYPIKMCNIVHKNGETFSVKILKHLPKKWIYGHFKENSLTFFQYF